MTHPADYIQRLISEGEHVHQDFKFEISDARKIAKSISAFANTEGGRLLVGVKDNGKIAGVRSEEEIYMIEAAAQRYCTPPVDLHTYIYKVEGKDVLEVVIDESPRKPVYALDAEERRWAYVRIKDENILASPIHLNIWQHNRHEHPTRTTSTEPAGTTSLPHPQPMPTPHPDEPQANHQPPCRLYPLRTGRAGIP